VPHKYSRFFITVLVKEIECLYIIRNVDHFKVVSKCISSL